MNGLARSRCGVRLGVRAGNGDGWGRSGAQAGSGSGGSSACIRATGSCRCSTWAGCRRTARGAVPCRPPSACAPRPRCRPAAGCRAPRGLSTTKAFTASPARASGVAMTQASWMAGWAYSRFPSAGQTFEARGIDHAFEPVAHEEVAFFVDRAGRRWKKRLPLVSPGSVVKAVASAGDTRSGRAAPVAEHDLRAVRHQFPHPRQAAVLPAFQGRPRGSRHHARARPGIAAFRGPPGCHAGTRRSRSCRRPRCRRCRSEPSAARPRPRARLDCSSFYDTRFLQRAGSHAPGQQQDLVSFRGAFSQIGSKVI